MFVWEWKLRVRRAACEFRLFNYRIRHSEIVEKRARSPYKGASWIKKSDQLALLRQLMRRELDEIAYVKMMAMAGPIKGGTLVLHVRDGNSHKVRPGPSIITLIGREANKYAEQGETDVAKGIDIALDILLNPYSYLDPDEKTGYDNAEEKANKIIEASGKRAAAANDRATPSTPGPTLSEAKARGVMITRES